MDILQNLTTETGSPFLSTLTNGTVTTENYTAQTTVHVITDNYTAGSTVPMTTAAPSDGDVYPTYLGFITAFIAVFFYGTNFAPVKKFDTGDGMFFQWVLCSAIMFVGIVVQLIRSSPKFYPIVMLGGFLWETGNICVVPIIKTIGLGLGLCMWGVTNLLSGWVTGRFGLFGLNAEVPNNQVLNYVGVALAVASAVIFAMVRNEVSTAGLDHTIVVTESDLETSSERSPLLGPTSTRINEPQSDVDLDDESFIDRLSPGAKRIVGVLLCIFSGLFYGQIFTPATYIQDNVKGASQNGIDYVFACYCGIYLTSTAYFLIYAAFQRNRPKVYPRAILPGFISGLMWGIATSSWFIANKVLSNAIAFPIVTTGPAVIASLLGVFAFHEIKGRRNYLILSLAMTVTVTGAVLTGLSKL